MAGILFSPGQDPFSAFGRGYETSIANLLAMEREQRQRDEDAYLKKQRARSDAAYDAFSNADATPRFFATDPSVVQGANLDAYAKSSGIMPPDELGTDTTGVAGQKLRAPQTLAELGINPGAAITMEIQHPGVMKAMGMLNPREQAQQQKVQAADAGMKQWFRNPDFTTQGLAKAYSYMIDHPELGKFAPDMKSLLELSRQDNPGVNAMATAYWTERNSPGGTHESALAKVRAQQPNVSTATFNAAYPAFKGFEDPKPEAHPEGTMVRNAAGGWDRVGPAGGSDVSKVMTEYPTQETAENVTEVYQKLMRIGSKEAMAEAAKLRPRIAELVKEAHPTMANSPDNVIYGIANGDLPPIKLSDGTVFGKEAATRLKGSKVQVAGAAAQTRGESYGSGRYADFLDTTKGNAPVSMSYGAMTAANEAEPGRFIPASSGGKALLSQARIGEVGGTISDTRAALKRLPDKDMFSREQAAQLALVLKDRDPHSALSAFMGSEVGRTLSNEQIDYVTALLSLRESAMMMVGQLGGGRATDVLRGAIGAMTPGATTPSKSYATRQLDLLQTELDRLKAGVPTVNVPKVPTPTPTGVAPAPSGKMVQVGGDTLPDPTGLKDGRRAGPYVIRNGQWVKE